MQLAYIVKVSETWTQFIIIIIIIIITIITITMATIPGHLYRTDFAPAGKPYQIVLLFTHKWFRREMLWREAAPRRSLKLRVTYLMGVNTLELFVSARKATRHGVNKPGGVCGRAVNTSNSGSGGLGFRPRPSRCFPRQETLLHFP